MEYLFWPIAANGRGTVLPFCQVANPAEGKLERPHRTYKFFFYLNKKIVFKIILWKHSSESGRRTIFATVRYGSKNQNFFIARCWREKNHHFSTQGIIFALKNLKNFLKPECCLRDKKVLPRGRVFNKTRQRWKDDFLKWYFISLINNIFLTLLRCN